MTSRERLLTVLRGEVPDCVPVCPDISNMIPARMTGKPFWDIYVYQDPPLWKAHINALKHFDIDGGFEIYSFANLFDDVQSDWQDRIVHRYPDGSFVTQRHSPSHDAWSRHVRVHTAANPPASNVLPATIGLPDRPSTWEAITGVKQWPTGLEGWKLIRREIGDQGILGVSSGGGTCLLSGPEDVYAYHDNPKPFHERRDRMIATVDRRFEQLASWDVTPDIMLCGGSGTLIWQTPEIFRELSLPVLKHVTQKAADIGIPTHVHSCGPEAALVQMAAEETKLSVIDPLEIPPMGDCNLSTLKQRYGDGIVLKGNLHTTDVMLRGTVDDVVRASRQAIDDAAAGGNFILSTGDQCGRDTPDENILAMIETARTYGRY